MRAAEIRQKFLDFFKGKNHEVVESSSLVPQNDPTLLFTNAGMNQFKDVFLGRESRPYNRATSSQKCVRAGGKHNDLENVGYTARHHTFFEMLGNFSFGDYFKKDAIKYAWDFSLNVLKLPKDKLYVTVFRDDDEAAEIWEKQEGVPADRIFRMDEKDNFWQMGDTGPCGPCSELFIDRGERYCAKQGKNDPGCQVGCDCDRFMEYWNLVFMQYDRDAKGTLNPLPKPSVDTGAGLERLASILQGTDTNYEIDLFENIIAKTAKLAKKSYDKDAKDAVAYRVISDHARSATFLIADGVIPANEGRGYVLRRIIRRAIRYGKQLGFDGPFLHKVCSYVVAEMKEAFPSISDQSSLIDKCVQAEEEQFFRTLEKGLALLEDEMGKLKAGAALPGDIAFKLYDTFGFPLDLTSLILRERGFGVDEPGFDNAMAEQKNRSRENWKGSGSAAVGTDYHKVFEKLKTAGSLPEFVGYSELAVKGKCLAVMPTEETNIVEAVFAKTPFYGESGGQVGDTGKVSGAGFAGEVLDVQKPIPELIVAKIKVGQGELKEGETYSQEVDAHLRQLTARNHTGTHLLHWALRDILGEHVKQAGSLVTPELLRFDFTHFQALSAEEVQKIEDRINEKIWQAGAVSNQEMSKDEAIAAGAIAMFGEKYGDQVRVVSVGDYSVELCGGTHVGNASEINVFKVVSEGGIAAGVRRIVAKTSAGAYAFLNERFQESRYVRERLKVGNLDDIAQRLDSMADKEKELRQQLGAFKGANIGAEVDRMIAGAKSLGGAQVILSECAADDAGVKHLREISDRIQQKEPAAVVILGMANADAGKAFLLASVGKQAPNSVKANELIKELAPFVQGRGGGKPDMAQAGGSDLAGVSKALAEAEKLVGAKLS